MAVIVVESLAKWYGRRRGVDGIDLSVPEGTLYGFLGPNGAGKSTAIRVLVGLLRPTSGTARIHGLDCWHHARRVKEEVGYVPGDLRLYPRMSGEAALRVFGAVRGRDLRPRGRELAEVFDLDLDVPARSMSRGMRQKLGLILALAAAPRLLILDEPTSSLDPIMQERLHDLLRTHAAGGNTVFFSSHSLSEVEQLCDRVAIIRDGRIVADDTLAALRTQAGYQVMIRWANAETARDLEPPPFLAVDVRDGRLWRGGLSGPVEPLIAWLAGRRIDDLLIERPDLETLFRRYYETRDS